MSKFLSGRQSNLKLGVAGYTENKTVLETTGRVGIGTTNAESFSLYVVGPTNITGIATFKSDVFIDDQLFVGGLNITGGATVGEDITARHLNLSGIATVTGDTDLNGNLDVDGTTELDGLNVDGATTLDGTTVDGLLDINAGGQANTFKVEDLTDNRIVLAGSGGELEDSPNLTFDGATLDVTGHTELDQLRVAGVSTFAGNVDISSNGNLTVAGNLIVQGTETRLNTTVLEVEDINIGIASVTPTLSDAALDGAGITIHGSQGDKTLTWSNANSRMEFNTDVNVANLKLDDNQRVTFGDGDDLKIFHNGSGSLIRHTGTGNLFISNAADDQDVIIQSDDGSGGESTYFRADGSTGESLLYYYGSQKLATKSYGVQIYDDLNVGTGVTIYGNAGIVSAISFYGDGSNLTNTGATLSATSGVERLVTTQLTSGTMVDAATDADLTFDAGTNTLNTQNIKISGGISTNGSSYGQDGQLLKSTGTGWEWRTVPGIFSVNNILNGFNVLEEGSTVGTAGSIHTLDFRGINVTATADPTPNGIATVTFSSTPTFDELTVNDFVYVGSGITMYGATGIVSATKLYGDGSDLTGINAGAILGSSSGTQRLVMTGITSGAMLNAATDADLTFNATDNLLSVPNFEINGGTVSAGGTTGTDGQYLESTGVGVTWKSFPTLRTTQSFSASSGQTIFPFNYNVNFLDVFVNGVKLSTSEYVGTSGTSVVLNTPAFTDEIVELHSYNTTSNYSTGPVSVLDDLTDVTIGTLADDQLIQYNIHSGQWENVSASVIVGAASSFATKVATATTATAGQTTFNGTYTIGFVDVFLNGVKQSEDQYTASTGTNIVFNEGASEDDIIEVVGLTANIPAPGSGSYLNSDVDNHLNVGTASTGQILSWNGSDYAWVADQTGGGGSGITTANINADTINSGTLNVSGVSTFKGDVNLSDNDVLNLGDDNDLQIYHTGSLSYISDQGPGALRILSNQLRIRNHLDNAELAKFLAGGQVELYYDNSKKFQTTNNGVTITGTASATEFSGGGSNLTGLTGASAGTYGDGSNVAAITVDANGRITGISEVSISGGGGGGISLTDLSVTTAGTPSQLGALAYNNSNGVFTFTPPDIEGQSRQALSVGTANNPLQIGAISYDNGTGVLTYTPPDLSSYQQETGDGSALTGIVTSIVAGTNVTVTNNDGTYTINSSGGGGGGSSGPDPVMMGMIF